MSPHEPDRSFTVWEPKDADVVEQFDALPGSRSGHVIQAMELYLAIRAAAASRGIDVDEWDSRTFRADVRQACLDHWAEE